MLLAIGLLRRLRLPVSVSVPPAMVSHVAMPIIWRGRCRYHMVYLRPATKVDGNRFGLLPAENYRAWRRVDAYLDVARKSGGMRSVC